MSGAIPLVLLYAYMAWNRINFPLLPIFIMSFILAMQGNTYLLTYLLHNAESFLGS